MTGTELVAKIKAKLNRIDSSSYEDVRKEEVLFFANNALKSLTLEFDIGIYSRILDKAAINVYLGSLTNSSPEVTLTDNAANYPDCLKFKDVEVFVTVDSESGWMSASRAVTNNRSSYRQDNPFSKAYPDKPTYRFIDGKIKFDTSNEFVCTKFKYDYLVFPEEITANSTLTYTFLEELQDKTVTLILENLEAQRLQSQPSVSRS